MKITLKELRDAQGAITKMYNSQQKDAKMAYNLSKNLPKINSELDAIEKGRIALVKKYGDKKGEDYFVSHDNMPKFNKEFEKFLSSEIELDIWSIPFVATENIGLTPAEYNALSKFIDEPTS